MNPTDVKLEEVLSGVEDDLTPVENKEDKKEEEVVVPVVDDKKDEPVVDDDKKEEEEEGFTANEASEEDKPKEDEEVVTPAPTSLDPETQYIVDNLPEITTRVLVNGEVKEVSVKSYTQLPEDVQFATPRDQLAFLNAMTAQENRAQQLQSDFRNQKQSEQAKDFEVRENAGIRDDITELQNQNLIPKFKVKPEDANFAEDPGAQEVQKVLDFMNKKNQEYLDGYNNGRAYRHIGFQEAYYMMPETQAKAAQRLSQQNEDHERQSRSSRVAGETGISNSTITKPTVPRGITLEQIVERAEQEL